MAEYIKLEDAIAIIEEKQKELCPVGRYGRGYVYGSGRDKYDAWDEIIDALENVSNADVAPVVRCENCVHWDDDPDTYGADSGPKGKCMKSFETMCADDFCSYGERKDEANES